MIELLKRDNAGHMLAHRGHLGSQPTNVFRHLRRIRPNGAQVLEHQVLHLRRHPTLPSSEIAISFWASTANSIGSFWSTSLTKPLTISAVASSGSRPRWRQ